MAKTYTEADIVNRSKKLNIPLSEADVEIVLIFIRNRTEQNIRTNQRILDNLIDNVYNLYR